MTSSQEIKKQLENAAVKSNLRNLKFKDGVDFFTIQNNKLIFLSQSGRGHTEGSNDLLTNKIKLFFKKYPFFFRFLYNIFGASFVGKSPIKFLSDKNKDLVVLNIGSGTKKISDNTINLDSYPFANVDIVADAVDLPLADESVDIVINEFMLEHVVDPVRVVKEIKRILKSEGLIYVTVPFVASFHSSPDDFYRWSKNGFRKLFQDFEEVECKVRCGPTSALVYVLSEWLGTILSFGLSKLQQTWFIFFMIILSPLNLIDYLIYKLPSSENIAYGFYFIGKKK